MKKIVAGIALGSLMAVSGSLLAADYVIDKEGQHAFINFKTGHMGFSVLHGRFNDFDGTFSWDAAKPEESKVEVTINTASVDSNHAERDKHLRSPDRKSTRLNSSHVRISYAVFCLKKKTR